MESHSVMAENITHFVETDLHVPGAVISKLGAIIRNVKTSLFIFYGAYRGIASKCQHSGSAFTFLAFCFFTFQSGAADAKNG